MPTLAHPTYSLSARSLLARWSSRTTERSEAARIETLAPTRNGSL